MGIQKVTFDGANVTSRMDADLYHFLFSQDVGILKGLRQECACTLANNTITFLDGYVAIYGRILYIENQTAVPVSPDSDKYGYVVVSVDTTTNSVSLFTKESVGTYPVLSQTDLSLADGVFEFALCAYVKTTTSVTLTEGFQPSAITSDKTRVTEADAALRAYVYPRSITLTKVSEGVYRCVSLDSVSLCQGIVYLVIEYGTVVSFPGYLATIYLTSHNSIGYRYAGTDYSLGFSYVGGVLTFTCGNTAHRITSAFLKK